MELETANNSLVVVRRDEITQLGNMVVELRSQVGELVTKEEVKERMRQLGEEVSVQLSEVLETLHQGITCSAPPAIHDMSPSQYESEDDQDPTPPYKKELDDDST